ncbi:MAG TPA: hypothetical protein VGH02_16185 [Rhizomicrobium sp.]|jgi:hypothetical protein
MRISTLALSTLILVMPLSAFGQQSGATGMFTPEQRALYLQQQKASDPQWHTLTPDQRRAKMRELRRNLASMGDANRAKLRKQLQAKFDALGPDQKQALQRRIAQRDARRAERVAKRSTQNTTDGKPPRGANQDTSGRNPP